MRPGRESAQPPPRRAEPLGARRGPSRPDPSSTGPMAALPAEHMAEFQRAELDAFYRWVAPLATGIDVLDVGCGAGDGAGRLLDAGARSVLGTDHDPESVELATRRWGERARFIVAETQALPLSAGSFGLALCAGRLIGTPDAESVIEGLSRLVGGGTLALLLPLRASRDWISGAPLEDPRGRTEWGELLRQSFDHVQFHRRRSSYAAVILGADGEAGTEQIDGIAWLGADPADEHSILALASSEPLPYLAPAGSMVGSRDIEAYRETIAAWEQRARLAEADGAAKHWELVASREAQRRLRKRLWLLEHSLTRRLIRRLTGRPSRLGEGPTIRPPENAPESWD